MACCWLTPCDGDKTRNQGLPKAFVNGKVSLTHPYDGSCQRVFFSLSDGAIVGNPRIQFHESIIMKNVQQQKHQHKHQQKQQFPFLMVTLPQDSIRTMDQEYFTLREQENRIPTGLPQRLLLTQDLTDDLCTQLEYQVAGSIPIVFGRYINNDDDSNDDPSNSHHHHYHYYYVHDPRYVLQENTVENPLPDGGGTLVQQTKRDGTTNTMALCSNVPQSFQNEAGCYLSHHPQACGGHQRSSLSSSFLQDSVKINLNKQTLNLFYSLSKEQQQQQQPRYIYAIQILNRTQEDEVPSPCQAATRSRWVQVPGIVTKHECVSTNNNVRARTVRLLTRLLMKENEKDTTVMMENNKNNNHKNNHKNNNGIRIRDIYFPSRNSLCHKKDQNIKGFQIFANGICWQHVHPDHLQIYDMTGLLLLLSTTTTTTTTILPWISRDDITTPAKQGLEQFTLPTNVPLKVWNEIKRQLPPPIGRLNQIIPFHDLNSSNLTTIPKI